MLYVYVSFPTCDGRRSIVCLRKYVLLVYNACLLISYSNKIYADSYLYLPLFLTLRKWPTLNNQLIVTLLPTFPMRGTKRTMTAPISASLFVFTLGCNQNASTYLKAQTGPMGSGIPSNGLVIQTNPWKPSAAANSQKIFVSPCQEQQGL